MNQKELNERLDMFEKNPSQDGQGIVLRGEDLAFNDLRKRDLSDADLRGANFKCADLREASLVFASLKGANLHHADLTGADLYGADVDYASWPLSDGSLDVIVDVHIARLLAYHFCRLVCDDPAYQEARDALVDFANGSHVAQTYGQLIKSNQKEPQGGHP